MLKLMNGLDNDNIIMLHNIFFFTLSNVFVKY
jgi:hypothetical protein